MENNKVLSLVVSHSGSAKQCVSYILEVLEAVEYIALNEEIINEKSGRLLGNEVLDNLIIKLNLQEENPAN